MLLGTVCIHYQMAVFTNPTLQARETTKISDELKRRRRGNGSGAKHKAKRRSTTNFFSVEI